MRAGPSWEGRSQPCTAPGSWKLWRQLGKKPGNAVTACLQGKLKCRLGGSQGHTRPHGGPEKLGSPLQGASQEAGQAGVGSILSLELHGRRAVCPLQKERTTGEVLPGEELGCVSAAGALHPQAAQPARALCAPHQSAGPWEAPRITLLGDWCHLPYPWGSQSQATLGIDGGREMVAKCVLPPQGVCPTPWGLQPR